MDAHGDIGEGEDGFSGEGGLEFLVEVDVDAVTDFRVCPVQSCEGHGYRRGNQPQVGLAVVRRVGNDHRRIAACGQHFEAVEHFKNVGDAIAAVSRAR